MKYRFVINMGDAHDCIVSKPLTRSRALSQMCLATEINCRIKRDSTVSMECNSKTIYEYGTQDGHVIWFYKGD